MKRLSMTLVSVCILSACAEDDSGGPPITPGAGTEGAGNPDAGNPDTGNPAAGNEGASAIDAGDPEAARSRDAGSRDDRGRADATPADASVLTECINELPATFRDFRADHPDFEAFEGTEPFAGLVEAELDEDFKPVYAPDGATEVTSGPEAFDQWYRDVEDVNLRFAIPLPLEEVSPGNFVFESEAFFPLDDMGWPDEERFGHNFHFTTEIHARFTYRGGEVFRFRGDDDLFLFVNGRLALDLGGTHPPAEGTVDFDAMADALGLEVGRTYRLDVFHAERQTDRSSFRIETSIECFEGLI